VASLAALKKFLSKYIPVDGTETYIYDEDSNVALEGLSKELKAVIESLGGIEIEYGRFVYVSTYTFDRYGTSKPVLASEDPSRFPPDHY
jgi:hypothetical protein